MQDMDAADADWEIAVTEYERHLETIRSDLPESVRHLLDDFSLHDAEVFFMGRQAGNFVLALRLETPPRDFLVLTYSLLEPPNIGPTGLPRQYQSSKVQWLFDEIDLVRNGELAYTQSILLSNGWQVQLSFREVQAVAVQALLPEPVASS